MSSPKGPVSGTGGPAGPPPTQSSHVGTTMRSSAVAAAAAQTVSFPEDPEVVASVPAGDYVLRMLAHTEYDPAAVGRDVFWARGVVTAHLVDASSEHRASLSWDVPGDRPPTEDLEARLGPVVWGREFLDAAEAAERSAATLRLSAVLMSERRSLSLEDVDRALRLSAVLEVGRS